nr:MAG TPA: large terminase [Caudoviricetes sp.]
MIYQKLSKRQKLAMLWWQQPKFLDRDAIICDGSIRSGKTVSMAVGFILWSMSRFNGQTFGICGRTIQSLRRNVIIHLSDWVPPDLHIEEKQQEHKLIVSDGCGRENVYYLFGGRDESSYTLVQGITLAGALLDEVALMPQSFVEQVTARCSVDGSKLWFNCNPGGPEHWFNKKWVLAAKEMNALHVHFTMSDNLSLAPKIRERYERMYTGVFYQRYILGLWVLAEGLVYEFGEANITDDCPEGAEYYISVDYGTRNPCSAGLWSVTGDKAVRIKEYYYSGRDNNRNKTDEEHCDAIENLARGYTIKRVIVDPSAASFITSLKKRKFKVLAANNNVLDGIRRTATYLKDGNIKIHRSCVDSIREFGLYCWDEKKNDDSVVKENDHAMDDIRYFCNTIMRYKVKKNTELPPAAAALL